MSDTAYTKKLYNEYFYSPHLHNVQPEFDKYGSPIGNFKLSIEYFSKISEFNSILDKYTIKCQQIKSDIKNLVNLPLSLEFDENYKVSIEDFKTISNWLNQHKEFKGKSKRPKYTELGKEVSQLWNLYLKFPKVTRLALTYCKIFQRFEYEFENGLSSDFSLQYLNKLLRVFRAYTSFANYKCSNCGHIEAFYYSSDDVNEPIYREKRARDLKDYLREAIAYYLHEEGKALRFLTLTIKKIPSKNFNKEILKELKRLFRQFSKRKFFSSKVDGYACVLEIKHDKLGSKKIYHDHLSGKLSEEIVTALNEGYHPHLHILILGSSSVEGVIPYNEDFIKNKKLEYKYNKKDTIEWNWSDVCNKSKFKEFHGSFIANIKKPEEIIREQTKRLDKKSLSQDEQTNALITYLISYVTKVDEAIKPNKYDFSTPVTDKEVVECPFINYIKSTERINFIQFGGCLTKSQIKKIPKLKHLSEKKKKEKYHCPVCYESSLRLDSVGSPVVFGKIRKKLCLERAINKLVLART